ncbi:MAG: hypothetical protein ABI240_00235 [Sphingomonas sp.]
MLAAAALAGLSSIAPPQYDEMANSITVELCNSHGHVTIPLGNRQPDPARDCPGGCHAAMCGRKERAD